MSRRLGILVVAFALACRGDGGRMPRDWGPLALGTAEHCPAVAGRYAYEDSPVAWALAGSHVAPDIERDLASFELRGAADTALQLIVPDGDTMRTVRLIRGSAYNGDYHCEDGWLHAASRHVSERFDTNVARPDFVVRRRALRLAPGAKGALIGRFDGTDYSEFTVWCGDGCKGIPLPWTFRTSSVWSMVQPWNAATATRSRRGSGPSSPVDVRVLAAERRLEYGDAVPGQDDARSRVTSAVVPGLIVRAVSPRDSGWHVSVEFEELPQLQRFMDRLSTAGPIAELKVLPLYRARNERRHWIDVVYVRFERAVGLR